jgi:hypothetical protein
VARRGYRLGLLRRLGSLGSARTVYSPRPRVGRAEATLRVSGGGACCWWDVDTVTVAPGSGRCPPVDDLAADPPVVMRL